MNKAEVITLFEEAINTWGVTAQMDIAEEEAAEFILALKHFKRNRKDAGTNLVEEIADLEIMVEQMKLFVGNHLVEEVRDKKLARLRQRLDDHNRRRLEIELNAVPTPKLKLNADGC